VFIDHQNKWIPQRIEILSRERHRFLDYEANAGIRTSAGTLIQAASTTGGAIEMETRQIENLKLWQKREIEHMINTLLGTTPILRFVRQETSQLHYQQEVGLALPIL
jgi:hypothetical protein